MASERVEEEEERGKGVDIHKELDDVSDDASATSGHDDEQATLELAWQGLLQPFICPFCYYNTTTESHDFGQVLLTQASDAMRHLETVHAVTVSRIREVLPFLDRYLQHRAEPSVKSNQPTSATRLTNLGEDSDAEDAELRNRLKDEKLVSWR
jgi:hypothetical protein